MPANTGNQTGCEPGWYNLLECPDCRHALQSAHGHFTCRECRRCFPRHHQGGLQLLPARVDAHVADEIWTNSGLRSAVAQRILLVYAAHTRSKFLAAARQQCLDKMKPGEWGLSLGCRARQADGRMINLDICPGDFVDVVGTAEQLPFSSQSLAYVASEEVFEHLRDPSSAIREAFRVLKPGGSFLITVPFILGFHSGPCDYWRFTEAGLQVLVESAGFEIQQLQPSVGAGVAVYRVLVEVAASFAGMFSRAFYLPTKAAAALLLLPIRVLDLLLPASSSRRVAGGFLAIGKKPDSAGDSSLHSQAARTSPALLHKSRQFH